ncbi:MAG TPA: phage holin family protein [Acidimicrobiales bacterium]|nr:phage holin family protein [Acidimicrobiales bacterium]
MAVRASDKPKELSPDELANLVIDYVKQETVEPVRALGRFLSWGIAGALCIAIGTVLLLVGTLRLLQTETGLTGDLSWIPYLIVAILAIGVMALCGWRITAGPAERRRPKTPESSPYSTGS